MSQSKSVFHLVFLLLFPFVFLSGPVIAESPLRSQSKENLSSNRVGEIQNERYKITFFKSSWEGGTTYVRDIHIKKNNQWVQVNNKSERFDEQWIIFSGSNGNRKNYYKSLKTHWIRFSDVRRQDKNKITLIADGTDQFSFRVTWSLNDKTPRITYTLTPRLNKHFVVGYQSFSGKSMGEINEVLSGILQHAKMVRNTRSRGEWELPAPMSLYEFDRNESQLTCGIYVPSEQIKFEHTQQNGENKQRYGMSLRNNSGDVQPILYAPQYGAYSQMEAGNSYSFQLGLYAGEKKLYQAYREILRNAYDYDGYRKNVFNSLTDTMYNLISLLKRGPKTDDSGNFKASPGGWWNRAKGFADIENEGAVRTSTTSVLLSAYHLTRDRRLYETRARPTIEYHLSRNYYGWTPYEGNDIYGQKGNHKMGGIPFDISTLSPLYNMTRQLNAGIYHLAMENLNAGEDFWLKRPPMSAPLAAYRMTGEQKYLKKAIKISDRYIQNELEEPYSENVDPHDFSYYYSKHWTELLEMYEETGHKRFLKAAQKEARRYVTQVYVRPVPEGTITVPRNSLVSSVHDRWSPSAIYDYPRDASDVTKQNVPKWVVSRNGMTIEQLSTYKNPKGGFKMNPATASFLLRLSYYTDDGLLRDIAQNMVEGRYTNYPGYYNRQYSVTHMKPNFPFKGPSGASMIYYHHTPAQLGMTIDYLMTQHLTRSDENISFPGAFESNYVWFKFRLYGHEPGQFYGDENVWLWMPEDIISINNHLVNWITAESGDRFYVSLTNSSRTTQEVTVDLNEQIIGFDPDRSRKVTIIKDNGSPRTREIKSNKVRTEVTGDGITALIVHGMDIHVNGHEKEDIKDTGKESYTVQKKTPLETVKAFLLTKPDQSEYNAYVYTDRMNPPVTLHYSTDDDNYTTITDEIYPLEWSVKISDPSKEFRFFLKSGDQQTEVETLNVPFISY